MLRAYRGHRQFAPITAVQPMKGFGRTAVVHGSLAVEVAGLFLFVSLQGCKGESDAAHTDAGTGSEADGAGLGLGGSTGAVAGASGESGASGATAGTRPPVGGAAGTGGRTGTGGTAGVALAGSGGNTGGVNGVIAAGGAGGTSPPPPPSLYVVAHPNDELLFMNPDLQADIQSGRAVTTVYITSADAGDLMGPWRDHETAGMKAHAAMAGLASTWTCATATYGGKPTNRCALSGRPGVRIIMLRVPDGRVSGVDASETVTTVDGATTYDRADLLATLAAIQLEQAPARVGVMDGTLAHGSDHGDHVAAGTMMFDVARADGVARQLIIYRGYSMYEPSFATPPIPAAEAPNLTDAQYQEKLRIVMTYQSAELDAAVDQWCRRTYSIRMLTHGAGPLHASTGQCLQATDSTDGKVMLATCNGMPSQDWTVTADSHILAANGKCLGTAPMAAAAVTEPCDPTAADQRWTLLDDGQIHGSYESCLMMMGTTVFSETCAADMSATHYVPPPEQRWKL